MKNEKVAYCAIVLDENSHKELLNKINIIDGYEILAHHMTMYFGPLKEEDKHLSNAVQQLNVVAVAEDKKVIAVQVETNIPSKNEIKHITIAVNRKNGGSPKLSNNLKNWRKLKKPFFISGKVREIIN